MAAETALHEAGMDEGAIATALGSGPPLTTGRVTGRLVVNGPTVLSPEAEPMTFRGRT